MEEKIDLVISYVDNQEPIWRKTFIDYCVRTNNRIKIADLHSNRYEDIGLIKYHLKLVEKNLPWLNKIYLLLSNKEQAPKNLPNNCDIVLHNQFIPHKYLPTFNSTTIEMFLWNIPNLSEKFIYANDDMLPIKPLKPSDFFLDKTIKMNYSEENLKETSNVFRCQCINSYFHILDLMGFKHDPYNFIKPQHTYTPMIKSHCIEVVELLKDFILPNIGAFRTSEQHNQYIYPNYEKIKYGILPSPIDFEYSDLRDSKVDLNHQIICVNNTFNKEYTKIFLGEITKLCE